MNKEDYIKIANEKLNSISSSIMVNQINKYYDSKKFILPNTTYNIGDKVFLKQGTLLHGTYKNIDGLKEIVKDGLISSWFIDSRSSKYPSSVGVWNLNQDYYLYDYINHYSGGTIKYFNHLNNEKETEVIDFNEMKNIMDKIISKGYLVWNMEQTKEARFMPSLVQNQVQIGIIFNGTNIYTKELLNGDILNPDNISDEKVKEFVNDKYYDQFIIDRKNKDDFFTNRESAILFGIPSNLIEGVLVGREYENNQEMLNEIKEILPNCYICNLDGKVIVGNK
jgi:hypothetical protein